MFKKLLLGLIAIVMISSACNKTVEKEVTIVKDSIVAARDGVF